MELLQKAIQEKVRNHDNSLFAVFDFDNTCIVNDVGEATFAYLCKNRLLKDKTLLGEKADGDYHERVFTHYFELLDQGKTEEAYMLCVQIFSQFTPHEAEAKALATIKEEGNEIGTQIIYGRTLAKGLRVRPQVRSLMAFLEKLDVSVWIMSGSPEIAVHTAMKSFGLNNPLIGVRSILKDNVYSSELQSPMSILGGKVDCMRKYIDNRNAPILVIDDSMSGIKLLETAEIKVAVNCNNELTEEARKRKWFLL